MVIIGAGVHGREVAEILRHQAEKESEVLTLGFVDDDRSLWHRSIDDIPVLGDWTWFKGVDRSEVGVICASGFSEIRKQMVIRARSHGLSFTNAISPLANLSPNATIGEGVVIYQNSTICRGASIGDHVLINAGSIISHDDTIGSYVTINPGVSLAGSVTLGEGCSLGIGCSVIQGISIGAWSIVGAGAAVIHDLPDNVTAVGVPARMIKKKETE